MTDPRPKTLFLDIDGVLFYHYGNLTEQMSGSFLPLPGVLQRFHEWDARGYRIILITGRRESMRAKTEAQLAEAGLFYDQLLMGLSGGSRVLINDMKPGSDEPMALGINLPRNQGLEEVEI